MPVRSIVREKTHIALASDEVDEDALDPTDWFAEFVDSPELDEVTQETGMHKEHIVYAVKNLWELQCMVRALDSIETLASMAHLMRA